MNDTATTEIYTLSLHDALPISEIDDATRHLDLVVLGLGMNGHVGFNEPGSTADSPTRVVELAPDTLAAARDRKSTRLNSSHANISYAVFCLKKKKTVLK